MRSSDVWEGPGWWLASDLRWYPPELSPGPQATPALRGAVVYQLPEPGHTAPASTPSTPAVAPVHAATMTLDPVRPAAPSMQTLSNFSVGRTSTPPWSKPRLRRRRRFLRIGGAVLAAAILVSAGVVFVSTRSTSWDPRLLSIVHFVEQHRGLTFKHPVKVEFLDDADFVKQVAVPQASSPSNRTATAHLLGEMRALGLVHGNVDLAASANTLVQADVVGLYVYTKKTVFVRGTALTPYVRTTLAHELTHALQDQYFDLTQLENAGGDADGSALTALIEGDAVRIQNEYEQNLSAADQRAYDAEQAKLGGQGPQTGNVPQVLSDVLSFPYAFGPTFVDALVAQNGNAAVDQAFRRPPVSEAQIVDPVAYPLGWRPAPVAAPKTGTDHRIDIPSPFGQVSLFEVLGARLGYDRAWSAVQGWQGDNSVPYTDNGRTCVAVDVAMADVASSGRLAAAGRQWAQGMPAAQATQSGSRVELRSCDPGPSAPVPPQITPTAFDVLSARATLIDGIMNSAQVDVAMSQCVADGVIAGVGPGGYDLLTANTISDAQQAQLQQLVASSAAACRSRGVS